MVRTNAHFCKNEFKASLSFRNLPAYLAKNGPYVSDMFILIQAIFGPAETGIFIHNNNNNKNKKNADHMTWACFSTW